jgi:hypothetical protein
MPCARFILLAVLLSGCARSKPAARPVSSDREVPKHLTAATADAASEGDPQFPDDVVRYHEEAWRRFDVAASAFNVADGIDRAEAELLGEAYFTWQLGACGFAGDAQDARTEWRMPLKFGVAGRPLPAPIRVDKATGLVSYAEGPSVQPLDLLQIERARLRGNLQRFARRPRQASNREDR